MWAMSPPRSRRSARPHSSSSSGFWGFCLLCAGNLRPFRLITLRFFHLPFSCPALCLGQPEQHERDIPYRNHCGNSQGAWTPGLISALFSPSSNSYRAWFCSHSSSVVVGRFKDLPQTMSSCLLTALQQMGQTEITRLALTSAVKGIMAKNKKMPGQVLSLCVTAGPCWLPSCQSIMLIYIKNRDQASVLHEMKAVIWGFHIQQLISDPWSNSTDSTKADKYQNKISEPKRCHNSYFSCKLCFDSLPN